MTTPVQAIRRRPLPACDAEHMTSKKEITNKQPDSVLPVSSLRSFRKVGHVRLKHYCRRQCLSSNGNLHQTAVDGVENSHLF